MKTPHPLMMVLWIAGVSWAAAILAYLLGGDIGWILPLLMLGLLAGIAEWAVSRRGLGIENGP